MCTESPTTAAELLSTLDEVRASQLSLMLRATSYGIGLLADGLGKASTPDAIRDNVKRISGRLRDIVVELDRLAGRISR